MPDLRPCSLLNAAFAAFPPCAAGYMPMRRLAGAQIQSFLALRAPAISKLSVFKAGGERAEASGTAEDNPEKGQITESRGGLFFAR